MKMGTYSYYCALVLGYYVFTACLLELNSHYSRSLCACADRNVASGVTSTSIIKETEGVEI